MSGTNLYVNRENVRCINENTKRALGDRWSEVLYHAIDEDSPVDIPGEIQ